MTVLGIEPSNTRPVQLRVLHWTVRGEAPVAPLYLRTGTGRLYRVDSVRRTRPGAQARYVFTARRILPAELPDDACVHGWTWAPRARRATSARRA